MSFNKDAVEDLKVRQTAPTQVNPDYKSWIKASVMMNSEKTEFDWLVDGLLPKTGLVVFYVDIISPSLYTVSVIVCCQPKTVAVAS